jgi:hypothetical protein
VAPRVLTKKQYDIFFGGSDCETCGWTPESLEVGLDLSTLLVSIDYSVGCYGGYHAEDTPLEEAIEWLKNTSRVWAEFEGSFWLIIGGLEQHRQ